MLTSAGVTAGLDLCLHLVRRDHGSAVAAAVARRLVMAPHRDGGQAQYVPVPVVSGNDSLTPLRWLINQRLHRAHELLESTDLGIDQIASATGFGSAVVLRQHFTRVLSTTPSRYRRTFAPSTTEVTTG